MKYRSYKNAEESKQDTPTDWKRIKNERSGKKERENGKKSKVKILKWLELKLTDFRYVFIRMTFPRGHMKKEARVHTHFSGTGHSNSCVFHGC